ncbi:MAG: tyrosine-type recombinase/integrase [Hyphomicrobiaceae bacterium]
MVKVELAYVKPERDRQGCVTYYYFRRHGRRWRLPGELWSEEFMAEYRRLTELSSTTPATQAPTDKRHYAPGTFGALVQDYLATAVYKEKKPSTRSEYRRVLESLQDQHGDKRVHMIKKRHIRKIRDDRAETPGAANTIVRMLKLVLNFAVDEEWIESNPAAKMKELKVGEWRDWTDEECTVFEQRWPAGTMQHRAYALAVYTGQRKGDVVAMTRAHRKDGLIRVKQGKTGEEVWIPEHRALKDELECGETGHMSLLTTSLGKGFDPVYFGAWFADAIEDAELPDDCVLHGLRKTAARKLADAGCTEEEIKAITGHVTTQMVSKYTKTAEKKKRASAAILKLENAR